MKKIGLTKIFLIYFLCVHAAHAAEGPKVLPPLTPFDQKFESTQPPAVSPLSEEEDGNSEEAILEILNKPIPVPAPVVEETVSEEEVPAAAPVRTKIHFGLGASYSLLSKLKFNSVKVDDGTLSATASEPAYFSDDNYSNVVSLEFDARYTPRNSFGAMLAVTYDTSRSISGGNLAGDDNSFYNGINDGAKLQSTVFSLNAVYRWVQYYIPLGLNYSVHKYSAGPNFIGSAKASGGMGYQIGFGAYLSRHLAAEAYYRMVSVRISAQPDDQNDPPTIHSTDFGPDYLTTAMLTLKYIF